MNSFVSAAQIGATLQRSLLSKLQDANQALSRGNLTAARNKLAEFKSHVAAKSGQGIAPPAAELLITDADYVIGTLR